MLIKKFQAKTESEAIMLAKEELGSEAIVMNIKTITPKGIYKLFKKPVVEVTAAIDDNKVEYDGVQLLSKINEINSKSENNNSIETKNINNTYSKEEVSKNYNLKDVIIEEENKDEIKGSSAIEEKLNNLQDLLEKQIKEKNSDEATPKEEENEMKNSYINLIYNQLINNEVDEKYVNQIIKEVEPTFTKDVTVDTVLTTIYQKIILKLGQSKIIDFSLGRKPKYVFFIGPTGVGKTTTIAKIASTLKISENKKIAFLTADTYRIAAIEQLRIYANILGIPVKVIYTQEDILKSQEEFSDYDAIFVDTAGRSHKNEQQREDIKSLISAIPDTDREVYLVLSATTKYSDLIKIVEVYSEITEYRLIFTKLDETMSIGNVYNIKMLTNKPLSYATWGQNVPDDFGKIDAQKIAKQLLGGSN